MWPQRLHAKIRRQSGHVILWGPPEFGAQVVINGLVVRNAPIVRLSLPSVADTSGVLYGNLLSDAVDEAFGFRLFGYGMPFKYGLSILSAQAHFLGKFVIAASGHSDVPEEVVAPLMAMDAQRVRCIVATHSIPRPSIVGNANVYTTEELALTSPEALAVGRDLIKPSEITSLWEAASGAYLSFVSSVNRKSESPPYHLVSNPASVPESAAPHVVSLFVRQGRWIEALGVAVHHDERQSIELFRQSAQLLLEQGLHDVLWQRIEPVPQESFEVDDEVYFLYFSVAMAVNQHKNLSKRVREYLEHRDAPDLRARWAVAFPTRNSLKEATKAFQSKRNVNTVRALAFVKTLANQTHEAVGLLREAMEMAMVSDDQRQVSVLALDVSHAETFGGHYVSAKRWAQWGLDRMMKRQVGDELLRLSLVNQVGYLALLTDEIGVAEEKLDSVVLSDELLGVPMMEALFSTQGDVAFVKGNIVKALEYYQVYYENLGIASAGFGALDVVKAFARVEDVERAAKVFREAEAVLGSGTSDGSTIGALAIARGHILLCEGRVSEGIECYLHVVNDGPTEASPFLRSQAVISAACAYVRQGNTTRAASFLEHHRAEWEELGLSGWLLFTILPTEAMKLRNLIMGEALGGDLRFLGQRKMFIGGLPRRISLRNAELAALLAMRPDGYRTEELLLDLYGDAGKEGNLKALISRLRKSLPILAQPYRLEDSVASDVAQLERLLAAGDLAQALELYKGPLLPESEAPGIVNARERIDEGLRQAVMASGEPELTIRLARKFPDDLELWETAKDVTPKDDPAYPLIQARVRRIRSEWGL